MLSQDEQFVLSAIHELLDVRDRLDKWNARVLLQEQRLVLDHAAVRKAEEDYMKIADYFKSETRLIGRCADLLHKTDSGYCKC